MNNVLYLKGTFDQSSRTNKMGPANIPIGSNEFVDSSKVRSLLSNLEGLYTYWEQNQHVMQGALVSVYYIKLAAKTNRIRYLLSENTVISPNQSIVGARFHNDTQQRHIITHLVSLDTIRRTIIILRQCLSVLELPVFNGRITHSQIDSVNKKLIPIPKVQMSRTNFVNAIVDCYYVQKFGVLTENISFKESAIITLYDTGTDTRQLLERLGISVLENRILNNTTVLLSPKQIALLHQKAPFLISMAVSDFNTITCEDFLPNPSQPLTIPSPTNEPTIGVIDTLFDKRVYFSEWVDYREMVDSRIPKVQEDYVHGTAVSSLIVDGPSFNPRLNDHCGRFKVRHFGVATGKQFSSFSILRQIQEIVVQNSDIKVWNLCLGAKTEINLSSISPEAAILDKIQYENDVIFVIAGTNKTEENIIRLGAPADSINSVVVNAVNFNDQPASYSRQGPVLSFFRKPDISCYGGDSTQGIRVCSPTGECFVAGTSFAAPWISRKLCYLIEVLGLNRELAKALLLHSSTTWEIQTDEMTNLKGYGIAPIDINDIVSSSNDEIRFMLTGKSETYNTYTYNIPIPSYHGKHPFIVKATLCYFPLCSRNQGVDYTNTELDIQFGRINGKIKPIDNNYQSVSGYHTLEADARKYFKKWNNVKHIRETSTGKNQGKKAYETGLWGLSLKRTERLSNIYERGITFGVIISLKHIKGENKIEDFVQNCQLKGWLVNRIDVNNQVEIYNQAEQDVILDD